MLSFGESINTLRIMKILRMMMLVFIAYPFYGWAQNTLVTGTVTIQNGETLPGVNVLLKGSSTGTITDAEGNYSINAPADGTLVFSFIGYKMQEIAIGGRSVVNIIMEEDITTLEQVVVVGYGTQEKKDITGAVSVIGEEAFESRPNSQFGNLIQGKTAGVQVISPSGKPSAGFSLRVRGTSSIAGSSEPLYVVDGIPSSDTRTINPADIESITVLKDASSAAIYGTQGANGVVLITTKKGNSATPKLELSAYAGFSSVWRTLKVLNGEQFRDLMTEMGQTTDWSQYTENTDWQNKVFQNGRSQNYQLAISGQHDKTTYYVSGGWTQQVGAVRSAEMDRYNFKVNFDQELNKWLSVGTNLSYAQYHDVDVSDNTNVNSGGVILGVLSTPPNIGVYRPNGTYTSNPFQDWENPLASTDAADRGYKNQRVLGNVYAEINILPDLKFRSNLGIDYQFGMYDFFLDPFKTSYGRATQGRGINSTNLTNYHIIDNTLYYEKNVDEHHFSVLIGAVAQKTRWENNRIEKTGFSGNAVPTTNAGSVIASANNDKAEKSNASFISRVTYDYRGKYLLTANYRKDGSSAFGPNQRWGDFPSVSVGWRVSDEAFFDGVNFMDDVKLRIGYGLVGNDLGQYAYLGRVASGANYPIGNVILPGTYPESIQNNDLQWETTEQTNVGLDLAVLNSRVQLSVDAYVKKTSNLLLYVPLPRSTGYDVGVQNVGDIENKGLEFQVTSHNLVNDLTWETDFNISFNRNKVINILGQQFVGGSVAGRGEPNYTVEGKPLGLFYGYISGGVDPATGMMYYIDKNGESTFTPAPDDRTFIGDPNPDFIYGMTNTFGYKNFSLSVFLQGSQGNDIFNATRIETEGMTDYKNQSQVVINRWRAPGDVTDIPRAVPNDNRNSLISTRFVEDGSYLRFKAITLGYNLPGSLLSKVGINQAKFYVTGENVLTITSYKGFDPEVSAFGLSDDNTLKNVALGVDFGTYPQTRNLIFGVNLTF
jgi:TonB-dependent starch-binding outer membrane protein SusC